jgi:arginyl-tRNA synthetase
VRGVALAKENQEAEKDMRQIAKNLYEKNSGEDVELWHKARSINTVYFENVLESLGSKMGKVIFESDVEGVGKEIVLNHTGEGKVFTESQGAVVYVPDEERKDINTSVFINSEGYSTYEAKDVGLIYKKFTEYGNVDASYFITDAEQTHHFKVVLDAASKIDATWKSWADKSIHVPHGRMLFKGAKMSSRLGGVPLALDVIAAVEEEVREKSSDKIAHLSEEEKSKLVRDIALSALRVAVLRSKPGININFDPDTSLSFEGDSGPYLMYTHARTSSLLDKGGIENPQFGNFAVTSLEREMLHYEEVLTDVIETLSPQKLVSYLFTIAQSFNSYYASNQIIVEGDVAGNSHRLAIVKRAQYILKDGLYVLGCNAPERM